MTHNRTRLNLESLGDRIVPSTTAPQVGQSGVVNAIYVEGTGDGGVDISNSPTSGSDSSTIVDFTAIDKLNPRRTDPVQPTLPNLPAYTEGGVEQRPRVLSETENAQVDQLLVLIRDLETRITQIEGVLKTLNANRIAKEREVVAQEDRVKTAQTLYNFLDRIANDPNNTDGVRYEARYLALKQDVILKEEKQALELRIRELNALTARINALQDQIYQYQRKVIEMQDAIDRVRQRADKGYPKDALGVPDHVFDITLIGLGGVDANGNPRVGQIGVLTK